MQLIDHQDSIAPRTHRRVRAPIRWYGGKAPMVKKLLALVPPGGEPYCEPYAGAASLFFARDPAPCEVLNDLNTDLVNLFRCLQDKQTCEELQRRLQWTLYARAEFVRAIEILQSTESDSVTRAWAFFVTYNQTMGGAPRTGGDWSRSFLSVGGMSQCTHQWISRLSLFDHWRWRLMRVQIDCRDALEVITYWDNPRAVFYIDPPYHTETRKKLNMYTVEVNHEHHVRLVQLLLTLRGQVVLSGYDHEVYAPLEAAGWKKHLYHTVCFAAVSGRRSGIVGRGARTAKAPRIEAVWINPAAQAALGRKDTVQLSLPFGHSQDVSSHRRLYVETILDEQDALVEYHHAGPRTGESVH